MSKIKECADGCREYLLKCKTAWAQCPKCKTVWVRCRDFEAGTEVSQMKKFLKFEGEVSNGN